MWWPLTSFLASNGEFPVSISHSLSAISVFSGLIHGIMHQSYAFLHLHVVEFCQMHTWIISAISSSQMNSNQKHCLAEWTLLTAWLSLARSLLVSDNHLTVHNYTQWIYLLIHRLVSEDFLRCSDPATWFFDKYLNDFFSYYLLKEFVLNLMICLWKLTQYWSEYQFSTEIIAWKYNVPYLCITSLSIVADSGAFLVLIHDWEMWGTLNLKMLIHEISRVLLP